MSFSVSPIAEVFLKAIDVDFKLLRNKPDYFQYKSIIGTCPLCKSVDKLKVGFLTTDYSIYCDNCLFYLSSERSKGKELTERAWRFYVHHNNLLKSVNIPASYYRAFRVPVGLKDIFKKEIFDKRAAYSDDLFSSFRSLLHNDNQIRAFRGNGGIFFPIFSGEHYFTGFNVFYGDDVFFRYEIGVNGTFFCYKYRRYVPLMLNYRDTETAFVSIGQSMKLVFSNLLSGDSRNIYFLSSPRRLMIRTRE